MKISRFFPAAAAALLITALSARAQTVPDSTPPAPSTTPESTAQPATPVPASSSSQKTTKAEPRYDYESITIDQPVVAMTFDDGPSAKLTPELLDILKERNIHATFFVIGEN